MEIKEISKRYFLIEASVEDLGFLKAGLERIINSAYHEKEYPVGFEKIVKLIDVIDDEL